MLAEVFSYLLIFSLFGSTTQGKADKVLTEGRWQLAMLGGKEVKSSDFAGNIPVISFTTDNKINGNTGCNSFSGSYTINGKGIRINPGAMTRMACPGNGEQDFLHALQNTDHYKISGKQLKLLKGSKTVATFKH